MPNQKLILSQKQDLKISPRQIQFLHFLQLNEFEIEEEIIRELEENPVLEWEEENDEQEDYQPRVAHNAPSEKSAGYLDINQAVQTNIRNELKEQFQFISGSEKETTIANFIFESVDDKGYLKFSIDELEDIMSFGLNMLLSQAEIEMVLKKISMLEPIGVGSQNLQEFLIMQCHSLKMNHEILDLLENHFKLLSERAYDQIAASLNISNQTLKQYLKEIAELKPFPFYGFEMTNTERAETIIPEYKVDFRDGELIYGTLSKNGRKLVFNENYGKEFKARSDKKLSRFLAEKRESAAWFIQAMEEREHTMNVCISAVVKLQRAYFISGSISDLKPMVLKDVAMITGKTISTLSRVTSQKYVQTHFGLVPMKSLFTEAIQRNNGELISNKEVQEIVSKLVSDENKLNPLTDAEICRKLASDGVTLTRRTITKYRENMNIPSSKLRRAL